MAPFHPLRVAGARMRLEQALAELHAEMTAESARHRRRSRELSGYAISMRHAVVAQTLATVSGRLAKLLQEYPQ